MLESDRDKEPLEAADSDDRARELGRVDQLLTQLFSQSKSDEPSNSPTLIDELLIRHLPDRFQVQTVLGRGTFGIVYLAHDCRLKHDVAIKILRPEWMADTLAKNRFLRESRAAARLNHSAIVRVLEADENRYIAWQVCDRVDGCTLSEHLKRGKLQPRTAAKIIAELASAVAFAHHSGVLHRDIKPDNILVDRKDQIDESTRVYLTDFGLAKIVDDNLDQSQMGTLLGTPRYMAPEHLANGSRSDTPGSDVFALGIILFECLTGRNPFEGASTLTERLSQPLSKVPSLRQYCPSISKDLETICRVAMHPSQIDRYSSADQLEQDLQLYLMGLPIKARRVPAYERVYRFVNRHRLLAGAAMFVVASLVAVAVNFSRSNRIISHQNLLLENANSELSLENQRSEKLAIDAQRLRELAETEQRRFQEVAWIAGIREAYRCWETHQLWECKHRLEQLQHLHPSAGERLEWQLLRAQVDNLMPEFLSIDASVEEVRSIPNTLLVATASGDGQVRVVDISTGKIVSQFETDIRSLHALAVDPNYQQGRLWIGGSARFGGRAHVLAYDWKNQVQLAEVATFPTTIESIAVSADGQKLLVGSRYEKPKLIDLNFPDDSLEFSGKSRNRWLSGFGPNSDFLFQKDANTLTILELNSGQSRDLNLSSLIGNRHLLHAAGLGESPLIAVAINERSLTVIDTQRREAVCVLKGISSTQIKTIAVNSNTKQVAASTQSGEIVLWDVTEVWAEAVAGNNLPLSAQEFEEPVVQIQKGSREIQSLDPLDRWQAVDGEVMSMDFAGDHLVIGTQSGRLVGIRLPLDMERYDSETRQYLSGPTKWQAAFSGNGSRLSLKHNKGGVLATEMQIGQADSGLSSDHGKIVEHDWREFLSRADTAQDHGQPDFVDGIGISGDGSTVAWPARNSEIGLIKNGAVEHFCWNSEEDVDGPLLGVSPDGELAIVRGKNYKIYFISLESHKLLNSLVLPGMATCVAWRSDNQAVLLAGNMEKVIECNRSTGEQIQVYQLPSTTDSLAYLDGGRQAICGNSDGSLRLLDLQSGDYKSLSVHNDLPSSIAISGDGRIGVSVDGNSNVAVWNIPTWERLGLLECGIATDSTRNRVIPTLWLAPDGSRMTLFTESSKAPVVRSWLLDPHCQKPVASSP